MTAPDAPSGYLGPVTEARFAEAFSKGAVITAKAACALLGLDPRTLSDLSDDLVIRAVRKGTVRGYVEPDLRAYVLESQCPPRRDRQTPSKPANASRGAKVVPFSAILAKETPARRS